MAGAHLGHSALMTTSEIILLALVPLVATLSVLLQRLRYQRESAASALSHARELAVTEAELARLREQLLQEGRAADDKSRSYVIAIHPSDAFSG